MNELLLSVIVPVYNEEDYLSECLMSLIAQTFYDFEIILIDDGSTDDSPRICDEFASMDHRIRVIHQTNQGMIKARYAGVKNAKGKYIVFCDADDFIDTSTYQNLIDKAVKHDADVVTSGCYRYYDKQKKIMDVCACVDEGFYKDEEIKEKIIPIMMWERNIERWGIDPSLCLKIIRKDLLMCQYEEVCNYDFSFGEDSIVIYPIILKSHRIFISHDCFYYHRQRKNNQVASYILSDDFIEKNVELYRYFQKVFLREDNNDNLMMQLDMFFIRAVKYIALRHPEAQKTKNTSAMTNKKVWLFPFEKISAHSRLLLHGAGAVGRQLMEQLRVSGLCEETLWVDNNPPQDLPEVRRVEDIEGSFDHVIIAVETPSVCMAIKKQYMDNGWDASIFVDVDFRRHSIYV